jgi:hypothetical protein
MSDVTPEGKDDAKASNNDKGNNGRARLTKAEDMECQKGKMTKEGRIDEGVDGLMGAGKGLAAWDAGGE